MYALEYIVGVFIVLVTIVSVLFILVLPRQPQGLEKLTVIVNKSVHYTFVALSRFATFVRSEGLDTRADGPGGPHRPTVVLGRQPDRRLRLDADAHHALDLARTDPGLYRALHGGSDSHRRAAEHHSRYHRRCNLGRHRCPPDRLSAVALQLVQSPRGTGDDAREPRRHHRPGDRNCWPAINWSASTTPCPSCMRTGSSGRPR